VKTGKRRYNMKTISILKLTAILVLFTGFVLTKDVFSHCQIPCGIYGDETRFTLINEHIATIEKSMKKIVELSKDGNKNANQVVRWVNNKDEHADKLSHIVTYYFLAQRVKPVEEQDKKEYKVYLKKVSLLHKMLVYAMKCKQTTDTANTEKLSKLAGEFKKIYF
jgi:nickel superoxide dismutase